VSCSSDTSENDVSPAATNSADIESGITASEPTASEATTITASKDPNQVLRHAVFFAFKETSSAEDITGVVDAFRELPSKIDTIRDFQWGTNNSPEGLDDGFTHCFILTFDDEDGRSVYLPHAAHKAFGNVLRPHMDKVFVIDYWGQRHEPLEKELKHAVFFKFKDDAAPEAVTSVEDAFAALPSKIDTIRALEWGKNNSPEKHDHGFTHCFMLTFDSEAGRETYLPHPDHKAFGATLGPVLDKVRVLDFWARK
jgi:hypothetical protein